MQWGKWKTTFLSVATWIAVGVCVIDHGKANTLDQEMTKIARRLGPSLDRNERVVSVGFVQGTPVSQATSGSYVTDRLKEALKKEGIEVDERINAGQIIGNYRFVEPDPNDPRRLNQPHALIDLKFIHGNIELTLIGEVTDPADLAKLFQRSTYVPISAPLNDRVIKPGVEDLEIVDGSWIRDKQSFAEDFDLRIGIVRRVPGSDRFEPVSLWLNQSGGAVADLEKGDVYGLRVMNGSELDMAIAANVDGISQFRYVDEERDPPLTHMVIRAGNTGLVRGWFINERQVAEFKVGEYVESSTPAGQSLGTIAVSFHVAWQGDDYPDLYERGLRERRQFASARGYKGRQLETQRGETFDHQHQMLRFTWADETLCYLAIRYAN